MNKIVDFFHLEVKEGPKIYQGVCPVHDGDNKTAFILYKRSNYWKCFTRGCHEEYGNCGTGLVRALCEKNNIPYKKDLLDSDEIINNHNIYEYKEAINKTIIPKSHIKTLDIPSKKFLERGYPAQLLEKYEVGDCFNDKKLFRYRTVVPIYDRNYVNVVAATARTHYDWTPKWLHSKGFNRDNSLYNSWFAASYIKSYGVAILTEGVGDVLAFEKAGIHCSLGLFGAAMTNNQNKLLNNLGTTTIIIMTDNDEAGRKSAANIVEKNKNLFNFVVPKFDKKDVGELSSSEIQSIINPILERYSL